MADGFLGRWSQRKLDVRDGKAVDEPSPPPVAPAPAQREPAAQPLSGAVCATAPLPASDTPHSEAEPVPLPSLDDVKALTAESDFSPFVARGVSPEVSNAAMKKLFTDPHYNVMDRLDIYIDDYSQPDPLPASMLRQMASAQFLKLFEDEEDGTPKGGAAEATDTGQRDVANAASTEPLNENPPPAPDPDHDHTDMRLQPNHALGPQEPGRGTQ